MAAEPELVLGPEALGLEPEGDDGENEILLLTLSALLEPTSDDPDGLRDPSSMSREEVRDAVLDAVAHPVYPAHARGRPGGLAAAAAQVTRRAAHVHVQSVV